MDGSHSAILDAGKSFQNIDALRCRTEEGKWEAAGVALQFVRHRRPLRGIARDCTGALERARGSCCCFPRRGLHLMRGWVLAKAAGALGSTQPSTASRHLVEKSLCRYRVGFEPLLPPPTSYRLLLRALAIQPSKCNPQGAHFWKRRSRTRRRPPCGPWWALSVRRPGHGNIPATSAVAAVWPFSAGARRTLQMR